MAGVYVTDRPEAASNKALIPASGGPAGRAGCACSELMAEDGTIPLKVILRCIADPSGLLWKKEEEQSRTFCFMLGALCIAHVHLRWTTSSYGMVGNYFCKLS